MGIVIQDVEINLSNFRLTPDRFSQARSSLFKKAKTGNVDAAIERILYDGG